MNPPLRRLRILYVADAQSVHTRRWVGWFAKRHDVRLFSVPPLREGTWAEPDITLLPSGPSHSHSARSSVRRVLHLRSLIADFRPDFVHAHYALSQAAVAALTLFPRVIVTAWGSDVLLPVAPRTALLRRWALRRALFVTGDSREVVQRLGALCADPRHAHLIQFGVDTERFRPGLPSGVLRQRWQLPADAQLMITPRLMQPLYNQHVVARAFVQLATRWPRLHLVFLAFHADAEYQASIAAELAQAGLLERVRFVPSVEHQQMPELYREASVIVSVPGSDATPVTLLEAMASGNLVVASDLPSLREWLDDGVNGFLVPPGELLPLTAALDRALGLTSEQRTALVQNNRTAVIDRASQDAEMTKVEHLLYARLPSR